MDDRKAPMNIASSRSLLAILSLALLASGVIWILRSKPSAKERENVPVVFFPVSSSTPIPLDEADSAVISELAAKLRSGADGVVKHDVLTLASIGFFQLGRERFEWHGDVLYWWSDSEKVYKLLKDPRLGRCFDVVRAKYESFDPSQVTASAWSEALKSLRNTN